MRNLDTLTRPERFRWAHQHSGKRLTDLAEVVGCTQPALSQWMSGDTKSYDAERVVRYAEATGVRVEWLLFGDGDPLAVNYRASNPLEHRALNALRAMEEQAPYRAEAAVVMLEAASGQKPGNGGGSG